MVVPVVAGAAFAAGPAAAAPSTTSAFQASVKSVSHPGNPGTCAHSICGTAKVAGYGSGTWAFDVLTFPPGPQAPCSPYTAISTFELSAGKLVLDETGTVCTPGNSGSAPRKGSPFNAPWTDITASWTVDPATTGVLASTGVFAGVTGEGSDTAKLTGPETRGTYTGTLTTG